MNLDITFVTETYPPEVNGVAMTVGRMVDGLRRFGHRVSIVRPRQHGEDRDSDELLAVRGFPLPGYPELRFGLPAGGRMARLWRKQRPDLVHVVTEGPLGWSAISTARRLGIPVTSGFHTNFDRYSVHYGVGWLRPVIAAYLRVLHRRAQATLVPTAALAAVLAGEGIPGVHVVGRGVDTELFDPLRACQRLRHEWCSQPGQLVCLYVGRLAPEKNLRLVCRAFAAIHAAHPEARMVWVGDGPARRELESQFPNHVFAGMRIGEELATHYASADLFLFPSLTETFGNVVPEAMASGLPVVAYRSAAAAELIVDGVNGRTVAPGDENAFIQACLALASDDSGRPAVAASARQAMLALGWDVVVQRLEAVMLEAVQCGSLSGKLPLQLSGRGNPA